MYVLYVLSTDFFSERTSRKSAFENLLYFSYEGKSVKYILLPEGYFVNVALKPKNEFLRELGSSVSQWT